MVGKLNAKALCYVLFRFFVETTERQYVVVVKVTEDQLKCLKCFACGQSSGYLV